MEHVASIDVGTNTLRLLIAEHDGNSGGFTPLLFKSEITRLGEGFLKSGLLSEKAMDRSIKSLKTFSRLIKDHKVTKYRAVATSVVREARNGEDFLAQVNEQAEIGIDIVSGEEEAKLTFKGVTSILGGYDGRILIFDIGGGSTEFILGKLKTQALEPYYVISIDLGVVHLTEKLIHTDPPESEEIKNLEGEITNKVVALKDTLLVKCPDLVEKDCLLVGTAGTITTLGAIYLGLITYDPTLINNLILKRSAIAHIFDRVKKMKSHDRLFIPGLVKGREDVIVAGILIVLKVMQVFNFDTITVSDSGLLEGILYEL